MAPLVGNRREKIVRLIDHSLGRSAIRIISGPTTGRKVAGKYWLGALTYVEPLIRQADRLLTMAGTAAQYDALPMLKHWRNAQSTGDKEDVEDTFLGDVWELDVEDSQQGLGREDVDVLFQPTFGEKTLQLLQFQLARIEKISGAVEVLEGVLGPSGMPAWSRNAAIEVAKSKLQPMTDAIVAADLDAAELILRAVEKHGEPVILFHRKKGQIKLDPEDTRGFAPILKSEFALRLPSNWRADLQLGTELIVQTMQNNVPIAPDWIMEQLMNIKQPYLMFKRWAKWKALMDPKIIQALVQHKMDELQIDIAEDEGIPVEEFMGMNPGDFPPGLQQAVQQQMQNQQGVSQNGRRMNLGPDAKGRGQANAALRQQAGNQPTPTGPS